MASLALILVIIAIAMVALGVLVAEAKILFWIGVIIAIVAAVLWLTGNRRPPV